jgi:hypothetical protein
VAVNGNGSTTGTLMQGTGTITGANLQGTGGTTGVTIAGTGTTNGVILTGSINAPGVPTVTATARLNGVAASYQNSNLAGLSVTNATTVVNAGSGGLNAAAMNLNTGNATLLSGTASGNRGVNVNVATANTTTLTGGSAVAASTVSLGATVASMTTATAGGGGLVVTDATSAVVTGGAVAGGTSMTLNNSGATFSQNGTGGPVQVHGVANGTTDTDAVNWSQLKKAYAGVASVSALAAIPAPAAGKTHSVGVGFGHFMGQDALAIGYKGMVTPDMQVTAGIGRASGQNTFNLGAGWSW